MTRLPREPFDAEERALATALPRLHGRTEPGPALDARVLAAAHAASMPSRPVPKRRNWIMPLSVAASLTLAVGLAWRLRPPEMPGTPIHATVESAPAAEDSAAVRVVEPTQAVPAAAPAEVATPSPAPAKAIVPVSKTRAVEPAAPAADAVPARAAPPAPPESAASMVIQQGASAPAPPAMAPAPPPAPAMSQARATEAAREQPAMAGAARMQRNAATPQAADTKADALVIEPDEDVPPATADSPAVQEAWLRRIRELLDQGRIDEAKASLAEFKRRHPAAPLPADLRALDP